MMKAEEAFGVNARMFSAQHKWIDLLRSYYTHEHRSALRRAFYELSSPLAALTFTRWTSPSSLARGNKSVDERLFGSHWWVKVDYYSISCDALVAFSQRKRSPNLIRAASSAKTSITPEALGKETTTPFRIGWSRCTLLLFFHYGKLYI